jgi:hypothetical protein
MTRKSILSSIGWKPSLPGLRQMSEFDRAVPEAVLRLTAGKDGDTFLAPHHFEAARLLVRLFERARLRQRVTMSYDASRIGGRGGRPMQGDLADSAADARKHLNDLARQLPPDCWGVLTDICGFDKGLQQVETERGWPRRSAKLILRVGLDHVGGRFGLSAEATGRDQARMTAWLEERPPMFED